MKLQEFRKLIREEARKVLKEVNKYPVKEGKQTLNKDFLKSRTYKSDAKSITSGLDAFTRRGWNDAERIFLNCDGDVAKTQREIKAQIKSWREAAPYIDKNEHVEPIIKGLKTFSEYIKDAQA